ncbi:hypothetical protein IQ249_05630 [Lusitaniella coriacea LEGE 07157]|uniref:Uncharacterized protein n=1 Tax=Lusitaniella coriacea LEGE 07157 TaxID=945747 RepID=A0A8J7AS95_9CYAN|nr:hypothetical protein [Lusitaniella coriacea]MBE9115376.1 hypothetical protein [Lusitaniella coriacea LEGE 07157]
MLKKNLLKTLSPNRSFRTGAIALALMGLLLPACTTTEETDTPDVTSQEAVKEPETVAENADELFGQTITARGEVGEVVDNISFTLADDDFFGGEEILIVNASGEPIELPEDGEVLVKGEVRKFNAFDFEGEFDLDWDPTDDYGEQPTIVAEYIAISPDAGEVTGNPTDYYGQTVAVGGEIEEMEGTDGAIAFKLDEDQVAGAGDLIVLNLTDPTATYEPGDEVVVTGQVRSFVLAEVEKEYDLTWDLDVKESLETEYTNKPVLIATEIVPQADQ